MTHNSNGGQGRDRTERGQYGTEYPQEAFLEAVEAADHASTTGVADRVGCSRELAYKRLRALEEDGDIESTDLGNQLLWETTN